MAKESKPTRKTTARRQTRKPAPPREGLVAERELIVITNSDAAVRASAAGVRSMADETVVAPLADVLADAGVTMRPLFGVDEVRMTARAAALPPTGEQNDIDYAAFYCVEAPEDQLDDLAASLIELDAVEAAYVAPGAEPAARYDEEEPPSEATPPIVTPDFTARQIYLDAAPAGVDARYAWTVPGGSGGNVRIIDIEGAWRFGHEDLLQNQGGVIGGTQSTDIGWRNHGTAVIGEFGGDRNPFGVTGICPDANTRAISIFGGVSPANAIVQAANALQAGDIILIELHRPGPRFSFQGRSDQRGYIAMEWWPDVYAAIRFAVGRGVVVVEAAGNGAEDLDAPIYDTRPNGFPASWRNPFNTANASSEAVIVGAGAPPPGTHGRNHGTDRSRLGFSNFGARVDTQGWGREVTTTGYGDLQGGTNEDEWYTDRFSGTSSASPIVVGALGSVQGVLRAAGRTPLNAGQAISLLRSTGSPQQSTAGRPASERIGNRPDLKQMIAKVLPARTIPLYRYWNPQIGDHFYTTNWSELGRGRHGWRYEGVQCFVLRRRVSGSVPLYRYWNPQIGDHFYTTNWSELGRGRHGWRYEGVQCFVLRRRVSGSVPLYRYWNPQIGDHFYTTNWSELGRGRHGWRYEGVQCYVFTRRTGAPAEPGAVEETGVPETFATDSPEAGFDDEQPSSFGAEEVMMSEDVDEAPSTWGGIVQSDEPDEPDLEELDEGSSFDADAGVVEGEGISTSFDSGEGGGPGVVVNVNIHRPD